MVEDLEKARHWRYFLLLESDFEIVLRYIEPDERNLGTFSLELAKQLQSIAAQVETIAKLLVDERLPGRNPRSMRDLNLAIIDIRADIHQFVATLLHRNERLTPFMAWRENETLPWWNAYNSLKHDPVAGFEQATLRNVRDALAALGLLSFGYVKIDNMVQHSRLFDLAYYGELL